jgi:1,4-alpha-glucan branching enzyme
MYNKGRKKGTVRFSVQAGQQSQKAAVAGDFSQWKPKAMRRQKNGSFAATLAIPPGRHEYKFVLDGDWVHDADVPETILNRFGTFNSVAIVD